MCTCVLVHRWYRKFSLFGVENCRRSRLVWATLLVSVLGARRRRRNEQWDRTRGGSETPFREGRNNNLPFKRSIFQTCHQNSKFIHFGSPISAYLHTAFTLRLACSDCFCMIRDIISFEYHMICSEYFVHEWAQLCVGQPYQTKYSSLYTPTWMLEWYLLFLQLIVWEQQRDARACTYGMLTIVVVVGCTARYRGTLCLHQMYG